MKKKKKKQRRTIMKSLNIYIIAIAAMSLLLTDREVIAQSWETAEIVPVNELAVDCSNITPENIDIEPVYTTIVEEDYPYLQNLECLKNDDFQESLENRGWNLQLNNVNTRNPSHFTLSGNGHKIDMQATYDEEGNLVESLLRIKDTRIPPELRQFIAGEFNGWIITGTEKVVKDFDRYQTDYNITLSNGDKKQELNFKDEGNRILFAGVIE